MSTEVRKDYHGWTALGSERPLTWKEGDLTVTRTGAWTGPGCHNGCFVCLYTDDEGKLVKVEGDTESPYNNGRLCPRCLALPQVVNHPDRLLVPMKRAKENRGKDKWERITWDEALDEIVSKMLAIKEEYGGKSVIFAQGTGRDISAYILRLAWSFGSCNPTYLLSGASCYIPRLTAMFNTTGAFWVADCSQALIDRYDDSAYTLTETMIIWGNNPLVANADGFFGHWVVDMMRRGTKYIVVDPRVTWLAAKAEIHIPLRPGTDGALALAMLNVIINEKLYDEDFVDRWCYGFDELAERVQQYPPSKVAEICWVPEEKIVAAARLFATSKPASVQVGVALDMSNAEAIPGIAAIIDMVAITGNLDVPGGMLPPYYLLNAGFGWGYELMTEEEHSERLGIDEFPFVGRGLHFSQPDRTLETMRTGKPYPIKAAWLQTTNPLACTTGEPDKQLESFMNMELNVVVDLFMTPTAMAIADYVLPAATFTERYGLRVCDGPQFGATLNKVTTIGEAKSDAEICMMFGKRWNPEAYPWDDVRDMYTAMLESSELTGATFDELAQQAPVFKPIKYKKYETGDLRPDRQPGFITRTGRIELYSLSMLECGLDPLPYYEEPRPSPLADPEIFEEYPLILSTGARTPMSFHSEHRQIPLLREMKKWPEIEINPTTAAKYGIEDGNWIWIENQRGKCQRKAKITPAVPEFMVMADHGWWLPEEDGESPNNYGIWRLNINNLMANKPGKSGFGTNFKSECCKIYKVKESE